MYSPSQQQIPSPAGFPGHRPHHSTMASGHPQGYSQQQPQQQHPLPPQRHKGTLAPGQIVAVGDYQVRIERYLSEGGYAHVYLTTSQRPIYPPSRNPDKKGRWGEKGYTQHCLKRIAFEDDAVWVDVRKEIAVMKSLPPNPHLVQYLGSTHTRSPAGSHEVFILMEFCAGGGIIDLLNRRLRDRLKEIEILNIFTDVCEAVAAMHALRQPLLHRDLKIENVLSEPMNCAPTAQRPTPLMFKLCDFGSTTFPSDRPPQTKIEADALAMDLNRHTTLQYRSPEMVEPMLGLPVGLPSDVWALGCLLYKLCYYTTPFEEHGPLAIVNAKYTFPPMPQYSPHLQHLIASMLVEQPVRRPSVFEVLRMSHGMSGTKSDFDYSSHSRSLPQPTPQRAVPPRQSQSSSNLLDFTDSPGSDMEKLAAMQASPSLGGNVPPQRRGRPGRGDMKESPKQGGGMQGPGQNQGHVWKQPTSAPIPQRPLPTTSSTSSRVPTSRLQVTGNDTFSKDTSSKSAPSSAISPPPLDAFGMPTSLSSPQYTSTAGTGFGDSFGNFTQKSPMPTGFRQTNQTNRSRYGANLPKRTTPTGFGESFNSSDLSRTSSMVSRSSTVGSGNPKPRRIPSGNTPSSATSIQPPAAESRKSPEPTSSSQNGDTSFETRFPSVESLDANLSPPASERLISPMVSPPITGPPSRTTTGASYTSFRAPGSGSRPGMASRPSVMSNFTGGDLKLPHDDPRQEHQYQSQRAGAQQQSRSTQVTGTAFRVDGTSPAMPGDKTQQARGGEVDYFASLQDEERNDNIGLKEEVKVSQNVARKKTLEDLMGAESDDQLQVPIMMPARTNSPGSTMSSSSVTSAKGKIRPSLPSLDSAMTKEADANGAKQGGSSIMSESWSPLEDMKRAQQSTGSEVKGHIQRSSDPEVDSSDDEVVPENPSRTVPSIRQRNPSPPRSATISSPAAELPGQRPANQRIPSAERQRPQSMFIPSSSFSRGANSVLSPPLQSEPFSTKSSPVNASPSSSGTASAIGKHVRQGSINGIRSKYEIMAVGSKPSDGAAPSSGAGTRRPMSQYGLNSSGLPSSKAQSGLTRKPSVANKPAALRKPSTEVEKRSAQTLSDKRGAQMSPSSPVKPKVSSEPMTSPAADVPSAPAGYTRPGITQPRPIPKQKPSVSVSTTFSDKGIPNKLEVDRPSKDSPKSSGSSPEKQQPVNLLIQRWNQGHVKNSSSANVAKEKRGGYI